jgi:hypothetical protein
MPGAPVSPARPEGTKLLDGGWRPHEDALLNGYRLAEQAYQLEVETGKKEYPHP